MKMPLKFTFGAWASKKKEDVNKVNRHGTNKLIEAIEKKDPALVLSLLRRGGDAAFRTEAQSRMSNMTHTVPYAPGSTPLHAACLHGEPLIVSILLREDVALNVKNDVGHTPLDYAILSYSFYKSEYEKKSQSKFILQRSVDKTQSSLDKYAEVINRMVKAGAKTGLFILPDEFTGPMAAEKHDMPKKPKF